jgi:peroxiredoxin
MAQFEPRKAKLEQAGLQVAYLAAERRDGLWKPAKFLARHPMSFPFLLDEDRSVTKAYGLYHHLAHDAFHVAHPATLGISPEGTVRYIYRGDNQLDRAPLDLLIDVARKWKADDSILRDSKLGGRVLHFGENGGGVR